MTAGPQARAPGRGGAGERGSLSLFVVIFAISVLMLAGLVYDGGLAITARQRAADVAEEAARAGANAIDVGALRAANALRVDEAEACVNAAEVVRRDGDGRLVACWVDQVNQQDVHVRVHISVRPTLLALFGFPRFQATSDASARPLQQ
jgi:Flp pilus assembly protein TadG